MRMKLAYLFAAITSVLAFPGCASISTTMGEPGGIGTLAIMYDPGMSALPGRIVTDIGRELATRGYLVRIVKADAKLRLDSSEFGALIVSSPIYAMKPTGLVQSSIAANSGFDRPVFGLLSGFSTTEEDSLSRLSEILVSSRMSLAGGAKIMITDTDEVIGRKLAELCDLIDATLHP